jgi:hypothetical protein
MVGSSFVETGSDARQTATLSVTSRMCAEKKLQLGVVDPEAKRPVTVYRCRASGNGNWYSEDAVGSAGRVSRARTRRLFNVQGVPMRDGHGVANGITFSSPPNGPRVASPLAVFGFTEGQQHRRRPRQWSTAAFVESVAEYFAVCLLTFAYIPHSS